MCMHFIYKNFKSGLENSVRYHYCVEPIILNFTCKAKKPGKHTQKAEPQSSLRGALSNLC